MSTTDIAAGLAALAELGSVIEGLPERIRRIEENARVLAVAVAVGTSNEAGLNPDHHYTPAEAARFFGLTNPKSMHSGDYALLPRWKGRIRGIWIMAELGDITEDEARAYLESRGRAVTGKIRG